MAITRRIPILLFVFAFILSCPCNLFSQSKFLYPVKVGKKYGYIDSTGSTILAPVYEQASEFKNGYGILIYEDNSVAMVNSTGKIFYHESDPDSAKRSFYRTLFSDDYNVIRFELPGAKMGLIDPNRKKLVAAKFFKIGEFHNGLAVTCENPDIHPDTFSGCGTPVSHCKYGYIDRAGDFKIPPIYIEASDFYHGYAIVVKDLSDTDTHDLIDTLGRHVALNSIRDDSFRCYYYAYSKYLINDASNEWMDEHKGDYLNGFIAYQNKHRNENGDLIFPPKADYAAKYSDGLAAIQIDSNNQMLFKFMTLYDTLLSSVSYEDYQPFHEGLAAVKSNGKWGFIDKKGKSVIPPTYDGVSSFYFNGLIFKGGIAKVVLNKKICYINKYGKVIWRGDENDLRW